MENAQLELMHVEATAEAAAKNDILELAALRLATGFGGGLAEVTLG
jgi:hypothetical protein